MSQSNEPETPLVQNLLCFALYATSRAFTRTYATLLEDMGITYPQYLVLLTLFENDGQTVHEIAKKLEIEAATTTPMIQRMETLGLVTRNRCSSDQRRILVKLTNQGKNFRSQVMEIPEKLGCLVNVTDTQANKLINELNKIRAEIG